MEPYSNEHIDPLTVSLSLFYFPAHLLLCRLILEHGAWWKQRSWSRQMREPMAYDSPREK